MKTVRLKTSQDEYLICVGSGLLAQAGELIGKLNLGSDAVVITNPAIRRLHGTALAKGLAASGIGVKWLPVPAGERSKSAAAAFRLIERIAAHNPGRKLYVMAFGGGVVGDLAGYVAAAYRRGIPYIQVPTTLLAQIDSAIGGKVGIDLAAGKNLVGAFYQPRLVLSDTAALRTLDRRQVRNGLAEAVKYGIISDHVLFEDIEVGAQKLLDLDEVAIDRMVTACSKIKARVVEQDEKETRNIRTILNFGHTVGHAIEAADRFRHYHHGEAVALGMRAAADISCRLGLLKKSDARRINAVLDRVGLPARLQHVRTDTVLKHMAHDKKFQGRTNRFVLANGIGRVKVVDGVDVKVVRAAVRALMKS